MRVLHLVKTSVGATWALRQMRELVRLGTEVHVAIPPGPLVEQYERAGIQVHLGQFDFPMRRPLELPKRLREFRRLVAQIQPDLIHSHFVGTTLTMRLALGKHHPIPRVFQVPGPLHLEHPVFRAIEIQSAGSSDYWIGSCHWTCNRYRQSGIASERVFLSFYGSDLDAYSSGTAGKLRTELRLTAETRVIGMVAYMYAPKRYLGQTRGLKGHEDLIDALAQCIVSQPNVVGVFAGGAWNGAIQYEQQVRTYGKKRCGERVIFLGTRMDIADLYADFDVAVHPSHSENLGGALESMIVGVPTIATNVGGFPDLVKPGVTGWLVPPHRPDKLAEAINAALDDLPRARQMAAEGQHFARAALDVRVTARQVWDIYKSILARKENNT
jgi:glycosyltransferase involved in cell wall biosynthesis